MSAAARAPRLPHVSPSRLRVLRAAMAVLQRLAPPLAARVALDLFQRPYHRALVPAERDLLRQARQHRLDAGGDAVQVFEWPGTRPDTVLLVHGWGSRAGRFTALAALLHARGWRVLALDAPGHGGSPGRRSNLTRFMAALEATARQLGPVHALAGHSFGALAIARCHQPGPPDWAGSLRATALLSMPSGIPFLAGNFLQLLGIGPAGQRHWRAAFERRFGAPPEDFQALPGAARIPGRVLLAHDPDDDIVPYDHALETLARIGGAVRLLTTHGLGHSALTRDPATLAVIADFIDGEEARP